MSEIEWGPEIAVDGKKPDWLDDQVPVYFKDSLGEWYGAWGNWRAHELNEASAVIIRIPAYHRYYNEPRISSASGSNAPYYDIEINGLTVSCNDVIDALGLNFNMGELFKATWRAGKKPGTDKIYDLDKMVYFANRERARHD